MVAATTASVKHVYIRPDGNRWVWAIHMPHDCNRTSTESFDSEWQAAQVAAKIAAAKGLPLRLGGLVWRVADEELEAMWQQHMEVDAAQGEYSDWRWA